MTTEKAIQRAKGFKDDFIKFAMKGNVVDMAVGVIIGGAFSKIVTSLVNDIVFPLLSPITGNLDYSELFWAMDGKHYDNIEAAKAASVATLNYGTFLTVVLDFLIIAFTIFLAIRWLSKLKKKEAPVPPPAPTTKQCPYCRSEIDIRATRCPHCTSMLD